MGPFMSNQRRATSSKEPTEGKPALMRLSFLTASRFFERCALRSYMGSMPRANLVRTSLANVLAWSRPISG